MDDELVERAYEFYSPEALRQRWHFLTQSAIGSSASSVDPVRVTGSSLGNGPGEWTDPLEMPHLSFFSEDVRDQIKAIYDDVQAKLPSSYLDHTEEDEDEPPAEPADSVAPEMSVSGKSGSRGAEGEGVIDKQDAVVEDGDVSVSESEISDSMEDTATSLFGTADLNQILADLSRPQVDAASQPAPEEALLICNPTRKASAQVHDTVPSDGESEQTYQAKRRALKDSSKRLVRNSFGAEQDQIRQMRSPPEPPRCKVKSVTSQLAGTARALQQLVDPNDSEAETDAAETESNASEDVDYEEDQDVRIRTMLQLLRQAPNGDCPWDVWLEATRAWPQLKIRLDDPDFSRRGQGLRVEFSVDKLKSALEEERAERLARNEKRKERRAKSGVVELIREAERRRDIMSGRWDLNDLMLVST